LKKMGTAATTKIKINKFKLANNIKNGYFIAHFTKRKEML
jgi:hypothetical protein